MRKLEEASTKREEDPVTMILRFKLMFSELQNAKNVEKLQNRSLFVYFHLKNKGKDT